MFLGSQFFFISPQKYVVRIHKSPRQWASNNITKICLYTFDPLKPHFYIVKLGFTGVYIIFLIFARKHRMWVFVRIASPLTSSNNLRFEQKYEKYQNFFYLKISVFGSEIFYIFE